MQKNRAKLKKTGTLHKFTWYLIEITHKIADFLWLFLVPMTHGPWLFLPRLRRKRIVQPGARDQHMVKLWCMEYSFLFIYFFYMFFHFSNFSSFFFTLFFFLFFPFSFFHVFFHFFPFFKFTFIFFYFFFIFSKFPGKFIKFMQTTGTFIWNIRKMWDLNFAWSWWC